MVKTKTFVTKIMMFLFVMCSVFLAKGMTDVKAEDLSSNSFLIQSDTNNVRYKIEEKNWTAVTDDSYNFRYEKSSHTLYLKNLNTSFTATDAAIVSTVDLTVNLEGKNVITNTKGGIFQVGEDENKKANLTFTGNGSLTAETTSGEITTVSEPYIPSAVIVQGRLINHAAGTITCKSKAEFDLIITCGLDEVVNEGNVKGKVAIGSDESKYGIQCTDLVPYNTAYSVTNAHNYLGNAYYFTPKESAVCPNNICGTLPAGEFRIVGSYNEDGTAIPGAVWYQKYYANRYGGVETDDFGEEKMVFIVYDPNPDALVSQEPKNIVAVSDGGTHTFNGSLYSAWMTR